MALFPTRSTAFILKLLILVEAFNNQPLKLKYAHSPPTKRVLRTKVGLSKRNGDLMIKTQSQGKVRESKCGNHSLPSAAAEAHCSSGPALHWPLYFCGWQSELPSSVWKTACKIVQTF